MVLLGFLPLVPCSSFSSFFSRFSLFFPKSLILSLMIASAIEMRFLLFSFFLSFDDTEQIAASSPCSIAEKNGVQQQFASSSSSFFPSINYLCRMCHTTATGPVLMQIVSSSSRIGSQRLAGQCFGGGAALLGKCNKKRSKISVEQSTHSHSLKWSLTFANWISAQWRGEDKDRQILSCRLQFITMSSFYWRIH